MGRHWAKQYKRVNKSPPRQKTSDCNSKTNFTWYLCALQVFVHLLNSAGLIDDSALTCDSRKRHQIWRLFTVSLVHGGFIHLFSSLIMEVVVGGKLEKTSGAKSVALLFFAGNALGEFMTSFLRTNPYEGEGASAGVAALLSAYAVHSFLNPSRKSNWLLSLCFLQMGCELFLTIAPYYLTLVCERDPLICVLLYRMDILDSIMYSNTSYSSHCGGYVTGILLGFLTLKSDAPCSEWTIILKRISAIIAVCLIPFLTIQYFFASGLNTIFYEFFHH